MKQLIILLYYKVKVLIEFMKLCIKFYCKKKYVRKKILLMYVEKTYKISCPHKDTTVFQITSVFFMSLFAVNIFEAIVTHYNTMY